MKLNTITIKNFRCFEQLTLDLHPELTVLIAPNGAGKTTLLDATRIAVWPFVKAFDLGSQTGKSATIQIDDVRKVMRENGNMEPVTPSKIIANGQWQDNSTFETWEQKREKLKPRTQSTYDTTAKSLMQFGESLQKEIRKESQSTPVNLPVVAYLGTGRIWYQGRHSSVDEDKPLDQSIYSRTWGYRDCLSMSSNYKQFEEWYGWIYRSFREQQIICLEKNIPLNGAALIFQDAIEVIKTAVNGTIQDVTGWHDIAYSASHQQQIVLTHPKHGDIPLSLLSDGLRNTVVMVAEIAFRCIKLNPHFGKEAARKTTGIVMIDEVDMFLHPAWQQTIIDSLRNVFPCVQFIITTHSPQVLSTIDSESIRIFKESNVHHAPKGTKGAESSRILKRVLGVEVRPQNDKNTQLLNRYLELIYADKWLSDEAKVKRQQLDNIYADEEPALTEADLYIENREWEKEIEKN
jgi:predicted ATP-binding protein involved in virulence